MNTKTNLILTSDDFFDTIKFQNKTEKDRKHPIKYTL